MVDEDSYELQGANGSGRQCVGMVHAGEPGVRFALLVIAALLLAVVGSGTVQVKTAHAADVVAEGTFAQMYGQDTSDPARWVLDSDGLLSIQGTGTVMEGRSGSAPYQGLWCDYAAQIKDVYVAPTVTLSTMVYWFAGCTNLESIDTSTWHISSTGPRSTLYGLFADCANLRSVNAAGLVNGNTFTLVSLFRNCTSLEAISGMDTWDTSGVQSCIFLFNNCSSLKSLNVTGLVGKNVTDIWGMFKGCSSLTTIYGMNTWDTSGLTGEQFALFQSCSSLESVDVSGLINKNVTDIASFFEGCSSLRSITGLNTWDTSGVTVLTCAFQGCSSLTSLDLSSFNLMKLEKAYAVFEDCDALNSISLGSNWNFKTTLSDPEQSWLSCTLPGDANAIWTEATLGLSYTAEYLAGNYDGKAMAGTWVKDGVDDGSVMRLSGSTAAETSAAISEVSFPDGSEWVVLARDDDFADAMSATGLAGALGAPVVLTDRESLSAAARREIARLGARNIYVIGGRGAIKEKVLDDVKGLSPELVERVYGENSWDTSVACAEKIESHNGNKEGYSIVAMSSNFQDALSISSFSYKYAVPIFLENDERELPHLAQERIGSLSGTIFVAGGKGAVPESSVEGIYQNSGRDVVRMSGYSGYDTSNQIATYMVENGYLSAGTVAVASGARLANGSDALSGSSLVGKFGGVMLLANPNDALEDVNLVTIVGSDSKGTPAFLSAYAESIDKCFILGGRAVVTSELQGMITAILK